MAVLGLATYGFSLWPIIDEDGWFVRFAVLAALCAAFGLLAKGKPYPMVTAALAAMGFLDALSSVLSATGSGSGLIVIVLLNALQAAAAMAALLLGPKADADAAASYEAYIDYYNQAVREYYSQQEPAVSPESLQEFGSGDATSEARAAASASRTHRSSQYGDYADLVNPGYGAAPQGESGRSGAAAKTSAAGLPTSRPAQTPAGQPEVQHDQSARSSPPP